MAARRSISSRVARLGVLGLKQGGARGSQQPQNATPGAETPKNGSRAIPGDSEPLDPVFEAMTERQLQRHVEDALTARGYLWWHVRDARLMRAGLPDIIAVHPTRIPRRVYFFELKTAKGRVSRKQREALAALSDVYGVDARVIRPADWSAALEDL